MRPQRIASGWILPTGKFMENSGSHASTVMEYVSAMTGVDFFALTHKNDPYDVNDYETKLLVKAGFPEDALKDARNWAFSRGWIMVRENGTNNWQFNPGQDDPPSRLRLKRFLDDVHFPDDARFEYEGNYYTLATFDDGSLAERVVEALLDPGSFVDDFDNTWTADIDVDTNGWVHVGWVLGSKPMGYRIYRSVEQAKWLERYFNWLQRNFHYNQQEHGSMDAWIKLAEVHGLFAIYRKTPEGSVLPPGVAEHRVTKPLS